MVTGMSNILFDLARFGSCAVDDDLIQKMQTITGGPVHHFIRRRIFWSHRYAPNVLSIFRRRYRMFHTLFTENWMVSWMPMQIRNLSICILAVVHHRNRCT